MLEMAVAYSKEREQFGVPVGSFQAVKHAAAMMLVEVESTRSVVYFAASSVDLGLPEAALHAAAAKAQTTAAAARVADSALTVHGAIGYTYEYDLQLFYKRAKLDRELFGSPAVWNERIAAALRLAPEVRLPEPQPERATA
jgi:alkylation response protein AidB-like acyl-CoA dehydrogenase